MAQAPLVKVAVVGVGYLGERHARIYSELPDVDLVAVVDLDLARGKQVAEQYRCAFYVDLEPLFGSVDAVSVVVPTPAHYAVATRLLKRNIHLLLEKPITATLQEADTLLALAREQRAILQVGHVEQFNPGIRHLKQHLSEVRFIECHRMAPFNERGAEVDVVLDLMVHDIEMVLSLISSPIVEISSAGTQVLTQKIDIANARLIFENGSVANLTASRVSQERIRKMRIFQKESYLSLNYMIPELTVCRSVRVAQDEKPVVFVETIQIAKEEPLKTELAAFVQSVRLRTPPQVGAREGRNALAVTLQIVDLIKNRQATSITVASGLMV